MVLIIHLIAVVCGATMYYVLKLLNGESMYPLHTNDHEFITVAFAEIAVSPYKKEISLYLVSHPNYRIAQ